MPKTLSLGVKLVGLVVAFLMTVPAVLAASSGPTFNDPGFANTWNRVDKPILDLPGGAGRGYTWGPAIDQAAQVTKEPYNGGQRPIQYFDKARMEVNNPNGNPNDLFYVTTGLLVKELVTGKRQDGDNTFTQLQPSEVQVAGDTNEAGGNAIAPTYNSFQDVGTFNGTENGRPSSQGQVVNQRINRAGQVSTFTPPEGRPITDYDTVTQHNMPDVFVHFANISGFIWNGSANVTGKVLFDNPVYVLGRPLTEAYWIRAVVRGVEQDVLVQLYERRVLTYTPANPAGFKVEMGNVGQHYYRWRYIQNSGPSLTSSKLTFVSSFGRDTTGNQNPYYIAPDSQGNFYTATSGGSQLYRFDSQGNFLSNLGQAEAGSGAGQFDGIKGAAFDGNDNLYVADSGNHRIQKFDAQGNFLVQWSISQRSPEVVKDPFTMAVDLKGNVYVLDFQGVRKYDNQGNLLSSWGSAGPADDQLNMPRDIGVDEQGTVYILDIYAPGGHNFNAEGIVKKFDAQGHFLLKWDAGDGPYALTVDRQGNVLVGLTRYDSNGKIYNLPNINISGDPDAGGQFKPAVDKANNIYTGSNNSDTVFKLDSSGKLLAKYYTYGHKDGQLRFPYSLAVDSSGNTYVYDGYNFRVQKFDKDGHFLLTWGSQGKEDGQFNSAQVNLAVDEAGNVYTVDASKKVQKFDSQGHYEFKLQTTSSDVSCNGLFTEPTLITVDGVGNIYIFDSYPDTSCIEKFDPAGHFLSHFGSGFGEKEGQFNKATSMVVDRQGNLYIADGNGRVCKYNTSSGEILKCWTGNGINPASPSLEYLAVDQEGNIFVADTVTNRLIKYDSQGNVLAFWESPYGGTAADPGISITPRGITLDGQNNIYFLDSGGDRVLKFKFGS